MTPTTPTIINGQADVSKYLSQLDEEVTAGNLVLLVPDAMHKEASETWISRRYLDRQSEEIFRLKGRNGGTGDQYQLTRTTFRTKTTTAEGQTIVTSNYSFRYFKPPLFGDVTLQLELTPQLPDKHISSLTIDLSGNSIRVSSEVNTKLVEAVLINAIARSFTIRRSHFARVTVQLSNLRVHHIDTGFGVLEYAIRRCIDQAVDDGTQEPTVNFDNGLTIKYSEMRHSGALTVEIIGRLGNQS